MYRNGKSGSFGVLQTHATKSFNNLRRFGHSDKLPKTPNKKNQSSGARRNRLEHHLNDLPIRFSLR
jgi:hypothetical protein